MNRRNSCLTRLVFPMQLMYSPFGPGKPSCSLAAGSRALPRPSRSDKSVLASHHRSRPSKTRCGGAYRHNKSRDSCLPTRSRRIPSVSGRLVRSGPCRRNTARVRPGSQDRRVRLAPASAASQRRYRRAVRGSLRIPGYPSPTRRTGSPCRLRRAPSEHAADCN